MTIPTLIFAFLLASLLGTLYNLVRNGGAGRLFLDLLLSWVGFALAYFLGVWQDWSLYSLGGLDLGLSIPAAVILLVGADWISRIRTWGDTFPEDENGV